MNTRSCRLVLEVITLLVWIVGIVTAVMLSMQYGILAMSGGVETKISFTFLKPLIKETLEKIIGVLEPLKALGVFGDLITVGVLSVVMVGAACICTVVSFVSLLLACCISGKEKNRPTESDNGAAEAGVPLFVEKSAGSAVIAVTPTSPEWPLNKPLPRIDQNCHYQLLGSRDHASRNNRAKR